MPGPRAPLRVPDVEPNLRHVEWNNQAAEDDVLWPGRRPDHCIASAKGLLGLESVTLT